MSQIKWAYDSETGGFSALPASPWLLPALGLLFLAPLAAKIVEESERAPAPLPSNFDPELFQRHRATYKRLMDKRLRGEILTPEELVQLQVTERPPWAESHETWSY